MKRPRGRVGGVSEAALHRDAARLLAAVSTIESLGVDRLDLEIRRVDRYLRRPDRWGRPAQPRLSRPLRGTAVDGFGVFRDRTGRVGAAIVSYELDEQLTFLAPEDVRGLSEILSVVASRLETKPAVIGLPAPVLNRGCGVAVYATHPGSAGAVVQEVATGKFGLLTAGHVAGPVGTKVSVAGKAWGSVSMSTDGTVNPADVAFVVRDSSGPAMPDVPRPKTAARPDVGAVVQGYGALTCGGANVMGIMPFQWFPALGRNMGEIVLTAEAISRPGDSGGIVTSEDGSSLVGLIIGTDPGHDTYTSVQLGAYALEASGCELA